MPLQNSDSVPSELTTINTLEPRDALDAIVRQAAKFNASDLFIQPNSNHHVISVRQMGEIRMLAVVSIELGLQLINLIKSSSGMDLAERRHPQDGRWDYVIDGSNLDFRVNSIGTMYGEDMVLRLLPSDGTCKPLSELGLVGTQFSDLRAMLNSGSGLILVTGPVGAGKSTSLYACLDYLNDGKRMIITLEDPIEKLMRGVRQCQVQPKIGLGFLDLLRGVLRQSPDVIMIGEIRDEETARTAVRAANSGHLVLATLHSPLAAGAIQSMLAYGVDPYFLSNSLRGVVAQRLVRVLSPKSRKMYDISHSPETFHDVRDYLEPGQGHAIFGPDVDDAESRGGYIGRTGLFEIMTVTREIKNAITERVRASQLHAAAVRGGMLDFSRAALLKAARGITGIEELGRIVPEVEMDDAAPATS